VPVLASIPSPSFNTIDLGPLEIHVYGILMGIAVATAFIVTVNRYERFGGDRGLAERAALLAVVIGFIGARLAYVSTHLYRYEDDWLGVFRLWEGGIALFGGLTFGTIAVVVVLRRGGGDIPMFADAIAIGLPAAQAIGRWGNYFNQELFGTPTDLPWGLEIDPINRPAAYPDAATFHPTFLYESLWNVGIIVFLLVLERRVSLKRGTLFILYGLLYGVIRFLTELIRTDTTFRFLGLSRNGWVSLGVVLGMAVLLWVRGVRAGEQPQDEPGEGADEAGGEEPVTEA
jgi:prolipoprotein diacylglyceryl transferase